MHHLLATITAASVLTHAVLGCCAHAHVGSGGCHATCGEQAAHDHAHCLAAGEPCDEGSPGEDHPCCRVKCQWLAPSAPADLAASLLAHALIFDVDHLASQSAAAISSREISSLDSPPALPLRSHLALGVLLV